MRVLTGMVRGGGAQEEDAEDERAIERSYTLLPSPFSHAVNNEALCETDSNQDKGTKKKKKNTSQTHKC